MNVDGSVATISIKNFSIGVYVVYLYFPETSRILLRCVVLHSTPKTELFLQLSCLPHRNRVRLIHSHQGYCINLKWDSSITKQRLRNNRLSVRKASKMICNGAVNCKDWQLLYSRDSSWNWHLTLQYGITDRFNLPKCMLGFSLKFNLQPLKKIKTIFK
jgi:hypothetical protein